MLLPVLWRSCSLSKLPVGSCGACCCLPAAKGKRKHGEEGTGWAGWCSLSAGTDGPPFRARTTAPDGASPLHKEEEVVVDEEEIAEACRPGALSSSPVHEEEEEAGGWHSKTLSALPEACFRAAKGLTPSETRGVGVALPWRLLKKPVLDGGEGAARFPHPFTAGSSVKSLFTLLNGAAGVAGTVVAEDLWLFSVALAVPSFVPPVGP